MGLCQNKFLIQPHFWCVIIDKMQSTENKPDRNLLIVNARIRISKVTKQFAIMPHLLANILEMQLQDTQV